jgi:FlaA1/EpsC-like NDP-sugar epimerase
MAKGFWFMKQHLFPWLLELSRERKRTLQIGTDLSLLTLSFVLAMALRLESFSFVGRGDVWLCFLVGLPPIVATFHHLGLYNAITRFITLGTLKPVFFGVVAAAMAIGLGSALQGMPVPATVPVIFAGLAFMLVGGVRFAMRTALSVLPIENRKRVLIYGAGEAGRQLKNSLETSREYVPVAFIDDKATLHGAIISGLRVHPRAQIRQLLRQFEIDRILLAIPSARREDRARIVARLEPLPVRVQTIPAMADLVSGKARISEFREVASDDLLGRDQVPALDALMHADIGGKVVLVTGAGGSIGSELCRQIAALGPQHLLLLDTSEYALYQIDRELKDLRGKDNSAPRVTPLTGSVRDTHRVRAILSRFRVDTIYHAAAYKHVLMSEVNMVEAIRNNVFGTLVLARAAIDAGVGAFILVSTDKAVRPTGLMGASKRLAELICQALASEHPQTRFCMVRFGNVLDSSGSVIPRFRRQIASGGPVTVTHRNVTRYFMTITEAAQLVIQAGGMARGGDVFVLDMGEPVKILDLAKRMIRLSGLLPHVENEPFAGGSDGDCIEIVFTGLDNGEKLVEELLIERNATGTAHPRIMTATETSMPWAALEPLLRAMQAACDANDLARLCRIIAEAPTAYTPDGRIIDPFWNLDDAPAAELRPKSAAAHTPHEGIAPPPAPAPRAEPRLALATAMVAEAFAITKH